MNQRDDYWTVTSSFVRKDMYFMEACNRVTYLADNSEEE